MNETTEQILKERSEVYGDYNRGQEFRLNVMKEIEQSYYTAYHVPMPESFKLLLSDIVNKLSRLAVSPNHLDSWRDIAGYAELSILYLKNRGD